MKKNLQLILSLLCILALAFGITAAAAEEMEARVITVVWDDGDNYDGLRGDVTAKLGDQSVTLTAANGWTEVYEGLPAYDPNGVMYDYYWVEVDVPEGYVVAYNTTDYNFVNGLDGGGVAGHITTIFNSSDTIIIEDPETPLGLGDVYNNVGDCFE